MNTADSFIVEGLDGKRSLKGSVIVNGAKNAALKAMAATILFDGPVTLQNVPDNSDIRTLSHILTKLGATVSEKVEENTLTIDATGINSTTIDAELAQGMRGSVVLTGPLLARFGKVSFPAPGGCVIGARPIDLFLAGYRAMGAGVSEDDSTYDISVSGGLKGGEIFFNKVTVGGTETLMMAAVLATGTTVLKNCAMEPEIVNVAEWLNACGAQIQGVGTPTITIIGTAGKLLSPLVPYVTIPDRITAGSFLILGALCAEELVIHRCQPKHMDAIIQILRDSGVTIDVGIDTLTVRANKLASHTLKSVANIQTHEYPGLPTDLQAPLVTYLTQVEGESMMFETIFEGRFKYVEDLTKLGANITVMNPREILVKGSTPFGALAASEELRAHDIRAGFAVVMAALLGKGTYRVANIHLIDRGYERLEEVLSSLGAKVKRVSGNYK